MSGIGYRFYSGCFREGVCFCGDVYFGGCCLQGCFRVFRLYTAPCVCILSF